MSQPKTPPFKHSKMLVYPTMLLCLRAPWSVVFRIMTPYELVYEHQHFGATQYLHLLFYAEDGHS